MRKHTDGAITPATSGHAAALRPRRMIAALFAAIAVLLAAVATAAVQDGSPGVIGGGTELSASASADQPADDVDVAFGATWS